jgi:twitching motility protein PilT
MKEPRGLVMVCGPTDSGKSTTLAAMIQYIYTTGAHHVITVEDPIEYIHNPPTGAITQRQLGLHTKSYDQALKHILRQDPDVIMVGEIRDYETAAAVLALAEAGHLVLSSSHASNVPSALERIVDMFPLNERYLSQTRLASSLVAVLCQTLVPRFNSPGRVAAVEILINNSAASSLIRDGKLHQLPNVIRTNHDIGMLTLDESLVDLYNRGVITYTTVIEHSKDRLEPGKFAANESVNNRSANRTVSTVERVFPTSPTRIIDDIINRSASMPLRRG